MSTSRINTSTLTFIDINTQAQQVLLVSSGTLTLNGNAIGGGGGAGAGLTASDFVVAGKLAADQNLTADVDNTVQFIDDFDPQNWYNPATYFFTPTIAGYYLVSYQAWFNAAATSTNQWNIQIQKNSGDSYTISQTVQNTNSGQSLNATKIIYMNGSTDNLRFRAYVGSTSNTGAKLLQGNTVGTGTFFTAALLTNGSSGANLISTTAGLASIGYISTTQLVSTTAGLQFQFQTAGFISSLNLTSTVAGLGSAGYASTTFVGNAISTFSSAIGAAALPPTAFQSTVAGLGSAGYISSSQLISTTAGLQFQFQTAGFLSTPNLVSTTQGLNTVIATSFSSFSTALASPLYFPSLQSTVAGLGSASYVSTATLFSTTIGIYNFVSTFIDPVELTSTVVGLGSASFVSSIGLQARLQSTVEGLGSAGYASTSFVGNAISTFSSAIGASALPPTAFTSTVAGLGSAGYISSSQLISTVAGLTAAPSGFPSTVSTAYGTSFTTLSLTAFQVSTQQIQTSSITGNQSIFQTLSSQALVVSSFFTATRQMTPMFVVF
jgi:hypothetical protein